MSADRDGASRGIEYLPGDRWLIAGDRAAIQLAGAAGDAMRWWPAVRAGASAGALIEQLYADGVLGTGRALSIVVVEGDAVRVLVQGDAVAVVETVAGEQVRVSGAGLLTWSEVVVPAAAVVHLDGPEVLPEAGDLLPMPTGVVQVGPVRWQLALSTAAAVLTSDPMSAEGSGPGEPDEAVTVIEMVPPAPAPAHGAASNGAASNGTTSDGAARNGAARNVSTQDAALQDTAPPETASQETVPPPVDVPLGDVTQSVTEDELEELADRKAGPPAPPQTSGQGSGDQQPDEAGMPYAVDGPEDSPVTIDASMNPFPSMALPRFVPPPFTPPAWSPTSYTLPTTELPTISPPPFVPASTSLPPISATPGAAPDPDRQNQDQDQDQDAVSTGLPPPEPVAPAPAPAPAPAALSTDEFADGDHDGHTQLAESLPAGYRPPPLPQAPQDGEVYAAVCPYGHPNAPHTGNCRVCGSPIAAAEPVLTARPLLGRIRLSSGPSVDLDRRIVIGRSPSVSRVASTEMPRLVTVSSPNQDISRSHVEVRSEDWNLVVTDLHSTNGTLIRAPDRPEQLLHPGQSMVVELGWTVDLGDGVSFVIEAAS